MCCFVHAPSETDKLWSKKLLFWLLSRIGESMAGSQSRGSVGVGVREGGGVRVEGA